MSQFNVNAMAGAAAATDAPLFKINLSSVYGALPWQAGGILEDKAALEVKSAAALEDALSGAQPKTLVIATKSGITEAQLRERLANCFHSKLIFLETAG